MEVFVEQRHHRMNVNASPGLQRRKLFEDLIELDECDDAIAHSSHGPPYVFRDHSELESAWYRVDELERSISRIETELESRSRRKAYLMVKGVEAKWIKENYQLKRDLSAALLKLESFEKRLVDTYAAERAKIETNIAELKSNRTEPPSMSNDLDLRLELEYSKLQNAGLRHRLRQLENANKELCSKLEAASAGWPDISVTPRRELFNSGLHKDDATPLDDPGFSFSEPLGTVRSDGHAPAPPGLGASRLCSANPSLATSVNGSSSARSLLDRPRAAP